MIVRILSVLIVAFVLANAKAQTKSVATKSQEGLATVSIIPAKRSFRVGEPITIKVMLEAGEGGIYIEKRWGQAGGAIPGFYVELETAQGKDVETCRPIADGMPNEEPDSVIVFARNFIFLSKGQIIGWSTAIGCPPRRRGKYMVRASYSPDRPLSQRIAGLPEVSDRVVQNSLDAKPVQIFVR